MVRKSEVVFNFFCVIILFFKNRGNIWIFSYVKNLGDIVFMSYFWKFSYSNNGFKCNLGMRKLWDINTWKIAYTFKCRVAIK